MKCYYCANTDGTDQEVTDVPAIGYVWDFGQWVLACDYCIHGAQRDGTKTRGL